MPVLDSDPLEMVMNIEETFHITVPDSDAEQIYTLGQLYAYVLAKLPQPPCLGCISSATFYRLRRALQELFAVPRERIRLATRVEDLIPLEGRPERWQRLTEALRPARLPELQRPRWALQRIAGNGVSGEVRQLPNFTNLPFSGNALQSRPDGWSRGSHPADFSPSSRCC